MKKAMQIWVMSTLILLMISCQKEELVPNKISANSIADSLNGMHKFHIGENYGGGIIFYIDKSGLHGLIASTHDLGNSLGQAA